MSTSAIGSERLPRLLPSLDISVLQRRSSVERHRYRAEHELQLVHLPPEPVSVADVARGAFGIDFTNEVADDPGALRCSFASCGLVRRDRPYVETERRSSQASPNSSPGSADPMSDRFDSPSRTSRGMRPRTKRSPPLLRDEGVAAIEIAPTKWRERPLDSEPRAQRVPPCAGRIAGLQIVSMQSLLFGRPDLQLFGDTRALTDYLLGLIDLGVAISVRAPSSSDPRRIAFAARPRRS